MAGSGDSPPELAMQWDGPPTGPCLALAHGAGAPMDSPFMAEFAGGLASRGLRVARFEFAYMRKRRLDGQRRGPDRPAKLLDCWREVLRRLPRPFAIGGKSMGGRIASQVADESPAAAVVCLGYPFHPAGKPEKLRVDHLRDLQTPCLIVQGERDPLGSRAEVAGYRENGDLSSQIVVRWLADGAHDFTPRKRSGHTAAAHWEAAMNWTAAFVREHLGTASAG